MSNNEEKITAPYGSWKSPLTADLVAGFDKRLGGIAFDEEGHVIWLEGRPTEAGRFVLVREATHLGSSKEDITPANFNVRTLVHEYGGGAFIVYEDMIIFSNYTDQRLYKQSIKGDRSPIALTPDYGGPIVRYADGVVDIHFSRYITVMEDHRQKGREPVTTIVFVRLNGKDIKEPGVLVSGNDFYSFPRLSLDGEKIAWIEWSHPNMPWDKAELWVGYFSTNGEIVKRICIAGQDPNMIESPTEPKWSSRGELFFVTDRRSGYWNLHRWNEANNDVQPLYELDAEFSRASWGFSNCSYSFIEHGGKIDHIACTYRQNGLSHLGLLNYALCSFSIIDIPFTDVNNMTSDGRCVYLEGASPEHPLSIVKILLKDDQIEVQDISILWCSYSLDILQYNSFFSLPERIEFCTIVPGQTAFAYLYLPNNYNYRPPEGEKPPLLVRCHGGPTSEARNAFDLSIQYWTSRGWAFADVNYGGSTGYGRAYRERLTGSWGVVDVDDCCSCAEFLITTGLVDEHRVCIQGKSAGGFTTLSALVFRDTFKAGSSWFGNADLSLFNAHTHKFESHQMNHLVGDNESLLFQRSPINSLDKLSCPVIIFQGLEDKVVPPEISQKIYKAMKAKGLPVALIEYEGEQHGFRKAENMKFTLEQQMVFFARLVGGFNVADDITPVHIDNFD